MTAVRMKARGFPRSVRLRRRVDFLRVQRGGEKHHVRHFIVFVTRSPAVVPRPRSVSGARTGISHDLTSPGSEQSLPPPRLGVTVTRKVGRAVARNRIKRLVREAFRRRRSSFAPGTDMVWVAKRGASAASFGDVERDMEALARRLERPGSMRAGEPRRTPRDPGKGTTP